MKKKLKLTNKNVRFLDRRELRTIKGGDDPPVAECTSYCVQGDKYYGDASPTKEV